MATKTIDQLNPVGGTFSHINDNLKAVFGDDLSRYSAIFSLNHNDYIPVSHPTANEQYTTYKLPIAQYEYQLQPMREKAISSHLSSALNLGDLAWRNLTSLGLGNLAYSSYILSSHIHKSNTNTSPIRAIALQAIDSDWGNLRTKDKISKDEVVPGGLPLTVISEYKPGTGRLDKVGLALSTESMLKLGDLAKKNEIALELSTLSHRRYIDLSWWIENKGGGDPGSGVDSRDPTRPIGAVPVVGTLPVGAIDGYEPFALDIAKTNEYGGIKVGYTPDNTRQYALRVQDGTTPKATNMGKAYVHVPWTDTKFNIPYSTFKFQGGENNVKLEFQVQRTENSQNSTETTTQLSSFTANITPVIAGNVVGNLANNQLGNNVTGCFALFSTGSSPNSIKIAPYTDAKINKNGSTSRYLNEQGTWGTITDANNNTNGLLKSTDYAFIQTLRSQLPQPSNNNYSEYYYKLPAATQDKLGGIQLFNSTRLTESTVEYYTGTRSEDLISLPVRFNSQNKAFVNIPKTAGDTTQLTQAIGSQVGTAVNNTIESLYPKGAIYITTADSCPLASLIPGSTWEKIEGRYLLAAGQIAGTSGNTDKFTAQTARVVAVSAGLPTHTHTVGVGLGGCDCSSFASIKNSHHSQGSYATTSGASGSIYGASATVRPPAFVVNVFMRTN